MDVEATAASMNVMWIWIRLVPVMVILSMDMTVTDGKICVKREEIGNRDGNLYSCNNPDLTECCERNRTFTCCQPAVVSIMHDQLWLLLAVLVLAIMMCLVVSWCYGQSEFFRSPTAKDAAANWKEKFMHPFDTFRDKKIASETPVPAFKPGYAHLGTDISFHTSQHSLLPP